MEERPGDVTSRIFKNEKRYKPLDTSLHVDIIAKEKCEIGELVSHQRGSCILKI